MCRVLCKTGRPLNYAMTELNVPCRAAQALGWIRDEGTLEPLIEAMRHEKRVVASCAAQALGIFGDSRACKPLIETFADSDPHIQGSARRAFERIGCSFKENTGANNAEEYHCDIGQRLADLIINDSGNDSDYRIPQYDYWD